MFLRLQITRKEKKEMVTTMDQEKKTGRRTFCSTPEGHHQKQWCGSLLVIIGLLWLSARLGWINGDFFGPALLILMGTWMVLPPLVRTARKTGSPAVDRQRNEDGRR